MALSGASVRLLIALLVMGLSLTLARAQIGQYQVLYNFGATSVDGYSPKGGLTLDSAGDLYGTCPFGGQYGEGMVWELDTSGN